MKSNSGPTKAAAVKAMILNSQNPLSINSKCHKNLHP